MCSSLININTISINPNILSKYIKMVLKFSVYTTLGIHTKHTKTLKMVKNDQNLGKITEFHINLMILMIF